MSIFVSVAAFSEPLLEFTLDGLFFKADHGSEITVGLVDQSFDDNRQWLAQKPYWPNVRYVQLSPVDSRGVSWARNIAFSLYQDEDHLLQIDSHTFFEQSWDSRLLSSLNFLKDRVEKPILTTYPPPFEFDAENRPYPTLTPSDSVYVLKKNPDLEISNSSATLRFRVEHLFGADFAEGFHVAAGFLFTQGRFVEEIPYDPFMYFHGEEQNLAIRAFTHGWRIFHPKHKLIPLYHLYKRPDNAYASHHWHADYEMQRQIKWTALKKRSDDRLIDLLTGKTSGAFRLGSVRSLDDFLAMSGIDYRILKRP
jgi:hypothetical protein